jgi:hypothetical protein
VEVDEKNIPLIDYLMDAYNDNVKRRWPGWQINSTLLSSSKE